MASGLTVDKVVTRVKRQFGDESGVQIVDSDIFDWINAACREIVVKNQILKARATLSTVAGQRVYTRPTDVVALNSVFYDGRILAPSSFENFELALGDERTSEGYPTSWATWGSEILLWPVPSETKTLEIYYTCEPPTVSSLSDLLPVPNEYADRVMEYVLSKAYELDEDWAAHTAVRQQFEDKLNEASNLDSQTHGAFPVVQTYEF